MESIEDEDGNVTLRPLIVDGRPVLSRTARHSLLHWLAGRKRRAATHDGQLDELVFGFGVVNGHE